MKIIDINKEEKEMHSYRKTARIAGLLFLAGTVTALPMSFTESILIQGLQPVGHRFTALAKPAVTR